MRWRLFFFAIWLMFFNAYSQKVKIPVAVLNLELLGIDHQTGIALSDRLRSELIKIGEFDVMERNRMDDILQEQGFQQTGACNTDQCVVEAGWLLGVSHIIAGSVARVGVLYTITARMIDVETGRIIIAATEDYEGPIENILTISLQHIAQKLSKLATTATITAIGHGSLKLLSQPSGARVIINDHTLAGVTPLMIDSLIAGIHVVRMQKDLQAGSKAIFVAPGETTAVSLELSLSKGKLKIISEPTTVEVFIDYQSRGFTPMSEVDLPVGSYYLKLSQQGYVDYTRIISILENETTVITARLIPMSYLTITSNPPDCQVSVDDSLIGATPLTAYHLKPGFHKLSVSKSGYVSYEETRSLPAGEVTILDVVLQQVASLTIKSDPAAADIFIDGVHQGLTPLTVNNLPPGVVAIKLSKDSYEDQHTEIQLTAGSKSETNYILVKKKGTIIIESLPGEALVEIDGIKKGSTRLTVDDIEYGKHLLRVMKDGYESYAQEFEINNAMPLVVKVEFKIARGVLFLQSEPKDAVIYLDGKRLAEIHPAGIKLLPGQYHLEAQRPGYEKRHLSAQVKPNEGSTLYIKLKQKTRRNAVIRSLLLPGWGQRYAEKSTRMQLFTMLEASALAGILISDFVYDDHLADYRDARKKYVSAIAEADIHRYRTAAENFYRDARDTKDTRRKLIIAAVSIWALNVAESAIFAPVCPIVMPDNYGLKVSLTF